MLGLVCIVEVESAVYVSREAAHFIPRLLMPARNEVALLGFDAPHERLSPHWYACGFTDGEPCGDLGHDPPQAPFQVLIDR